MQRRLLRRSKLVSLLLPGLLLGWGGQGNAATDEAELVLVPHCTGPNGELTSIDFRGQNFNWPGDETQIAQLRAALGTPEAGSVRIKGNASTPYRCIGGLIFSLQRLGISKIAFISEPQAAASLTPPESRPFDETADAAAQVDTALIRAKGDGHDVMLVFGANWCHDSRALADWFATDRFKPMLAKRYEIVWIDVGMKDRHIDLARRFGLDGIKGTPTVLILDSEGHPLNLKDAPGWRNAASRSVDSVYAYFEKMGD